MKITSDKIRNIFLPLCLAGCMVLMGNSSCKMQKPQGKAKPSPQTEFPSPEIEVPSPEVESPEKSSGIFRRSRDTIVLESEMRGVWLATVKGIDWPSARDNATTQKMKLEALINGAKEVGCNTIFLQVCSNMDAIYPSEILPWSEVISGSEGINPGYDPVEAAIQCAHLQGMQIHAWINPLRVGPVDKRRAPSSVANTHPEWVRKFAGNLYLDPGFPEVREFLGEIATEILTKYDFDGLHIDDYFYPAGLKEGGSGWNDAALYKKYGSGSTLDAWRYSNIDALVATLYKATKRVDAALPFGVSPSGRLLNTNKLYANPAHWTAQGTVDYLVPQIYWTIERGDVAAFDKVTAEWKDVVEGRGVKMFTGIAAYRYGESRGIDAAFASLEEFSRQLKICRKTPYVYGHVWFRTEHLLRKDFREYVRDNLYDGECLAPELVPGLEASLSSPAITLEDDVLTWKEVRGADSYAVFLLSPDGIRKWRGSLAYRGQARRFRGQSGENYVVMALRGGQRSPLSPVVRIP